MPQIMVGVKALTIFLLRLAQIAMAYGAVAWAAKLPLC